MAKHNPSLLHVAKVYERMHRLLKRKLGRHVTHAEVQAVIRRGKKR